MNNLDLTVIIVSWRVKDLLKNCLSSIYTNTTNINFEVIVVDNASCDGSVEMVIGYFPQVKLISNLRNRGFARANNQAIGQARGRQLLLLNPDTIIVDNALADMVSFMDRHPEVGVAGCRILNPDKTWQPSVRKFPTLLDHLMMMFKLHHFFQLKDYRQLEFDEHKEQEVDQVMGAFFMINSNVVKRVGHFDEGYLNWFEEVDFCWRAKKAGLKVVYTPQAEIIHWRGQSFRQLYRTHGQWIFCRSRLRYIRKNQGTLAFLIILFLTPFSLLFSLLFSIISPKNV